MLWPPFCFLGIRKPDQTFLITSLDRFITKKKFNDGLINKMVKASGPFENRTNRPIFKWSAAILFLRHLKTGPDVLIASLDRFTKKNKNLFTKFYFSYVCIQMVQNLLYFSKHYVSILIVTKY
jgi:hypothetical protein